MVYRCSVSWSSPRHPQILPSVKYEPDPILPLSDAGLTKSASKRTRVIDEDEEIALFSRVRIRALNRNDNPFLITVLVLPSKRAWTLMHQQAQCFFDTGCFQGNIVSKDFARKLGYTPSDFMSLQPGERNGGISATGHIGIPEGALHLSWYHSSSPRVFRRMRFLISPTLQFDIVIGVDSILKHNILSAPKLIQLLSLPSRLESYCRRLKPQLFDQTKT